MTNTYSGLVSSSKFKPIFTSMKEGAKKKVRRAGC